MKKIYNILIVVLLISFSACENDPIGPFVKIGDGPMFTTPTGGTSFVLSEEAEDEILTYFTWNGADFGFKAEVMYDLQMAATGTDFAVPVTVLSTNNEKDSVTVGFLNNKLLTNDFTFAVAHTLDFRLMATIHEDLDTLYSDVISLTITPFEKVIVYPSLWVPGDYWTPNWSPGESPQLYSLKSNNKYEGYVYFAGADGHYKFTSMPDWNGTNYGYDSGTDLEGTLSDDSGAGNLYMTNPGYYKINVDLTALTFKAEATEWGLIGGAVPPYDWSADVNMTYDNVNGVWTVTLDLVAGDIKFRANDGWDINYGSDDANGILGAGAGNIPIASGGNYTIVLDLRGPLYRYTVTKN